MTNELPAIVGILFLIFGIFTVWLYIDIAMFVYAVLTTGFHAYPKWRWVTAIVFTILGKISFNSGSN